MFRRERRGNNPPLSLQDIFNHIVGDIEIFVGQITAAQAKTAKKKKKKKKGNLKLKGGQTLAYFGI